MEPQQRPHTLSWANKFLRRAASHLSSSSCSPPASCWIVSSVHSIWGCEGARVWVRVSGLKRLKASPGGTRTTVAWRRPAQQSVRGKSNFRFSYFKYRLGWKIAFRFWLCVHFGPLLRQNSHRPPTVLGMFPVVSRPLQDLQTFKHTLCVRFAFVRCWCWATSRFGDKRLSESIRMRERLCCPPPHFIIVFIYVGLAFHIMKEMGGECETMKQQTTGTHCVAID